MKKSNFKNGLKRWPFLLDHYIFNTESLKHFHKEGPTINEGIAVDARLVQSASRPISNDEIRKLREKRQTHEGNVDKNGRPVKFSRDIESDWVVQEDLQETLHCGTILRVGRLPLTSKEEPAYMDLRIFIGQVCPDSKK